MEEVTPKKELMIARLILALVCFLVSDIVAKDVMLFVFILNLERRLYKPSSASNILTSEDVFNLSDEIIAGDNFSKEEGINPCILASSKAILEELGIYSKAEL